MITEAKMIFSNLIDNLAADESLKMTDGKTKGPSISSYKSNLNMKALSKFIRGGISKMSKEDMTSIMNNSSSYKKDKYTINNQELISDPEQIKIIKAPVSQNIRVIAGAATGKSTVIACRIKYLLDYHTTPDKILVLTFNMEARRNLEKILDQMMGFSIKMEIRTIDSFCYKLNNDFTNNPENNDNEKKSFNNCVVRTINNEGETEYMIESSYGELGTTSRKIIEKYGSLICSQYKYVFFDEFQDVNEDQFCILKEFANRGCKVMVSGDDSQNTYQFRGSDNYYIINVDKLFDSSLTYTITTNYRNAKEIIKMSNDFITNNKEKIVKTTKPFDNDANDLKRGIIDMTIHKSENDKIENIITQIKHYTDDLKIPFDEIAILSRNVHPLKRIETEFEKNELPFVALNHDQKEYKQIIENGKIVLSTIHKTKGLEWTVVFIVGLSDSYFPNHSNNDLKNIEAERRLFYVAVTRAKQYLHFATEAREMPYSRFITEVKHHVNVMMKTNIQNKHIFKSIDECKTQDSYSLTEVMQMIDVKKMDELRDKKLLPPMKIKNKNNVVTKQLFPEQLHFTEAIKKNCFEPDYEMYCNCYLTKKLSLQNKQAIKVIPVERILLNLHLSKLEKTLYSKYDVGKCLSKKIIPHAKNENEKDILKNLMDRLEYSVEINNLSFDDLDVLSLGNDNPDDPYQYPDSFMKKLGECYESYKNTNGSLDKIKEAIYYVSLCYKFNEQTNGLKLIYRNVQNLFEQNDANVFSRIDEYAKLLAKDNILCKITVSKNYKINNETIHLTGEIDYINVTTGSIVSIKCSETEFDPTWLVQLMIRYALFMNSPSCCDKYDSIKINKVGAINIFNGKYYEMIIPKNYDYNALLNFVGTVIEDDIKGIEKKETNNDNYLNVMTMITNDETIKLLEANESNNNDVINVDTFETFSLDYFPEMQQGYIVLDVENNCTNSDIIQLAYIVYDDEDNETKRINKYIKDRCVDNRTIKITGITIERLETEGVSFDTVMKEFLTDLVGTKVICGHNVNTDMAKIKSNLHKYKLQLVLNDSNIDLFENLTIRDTMIMYKSFKGQGKNVTLGNMFKELFGKDMVNAHDALSDVEHTAKCYVELNRLMNLENTLADENFISLESKLEISKNINKSLIDNNKVNDISLVKEVSPKNHTTKIKKQKQENKQENQQQIDDGLMGIINSKFF
jgi:hypothetical protein